MGLLTSSLPPICPRDKHCSEWARQYIKYCLCDVRDGVSLALGLVSVISWGVAEIPQIITNYRKKSTEGLSIAFLMTWIVGDLFNSFGCMLEPATLPTQFYMAILFTLTTLVLAGQTIYYGHIYHRLKSNRPSHKTEAVEKRIPCSGVAKKQDNNVDRWGNAIDDFGLGVAQSSPIPLPGVPRSSSLERELYYMSARSLTRSHTPTSGSFLAQRITLTTLSRQNTFEEPLLGGLASTQSAPPSNNKTMLCAFSAVTFFLGTLNLHLTESNGLRMVSGKRYKGVVMQVGRKLLQVSGGFMEETRGAGSSRIGTLLGWGMAAIYMGGRLPQICLNIRRGHLEGLSPFMFIFALVGNITYVASILVSSLDWSKLSANLPWLVDAGGCVVLDTFILIQFIYFHHRALQDDDVNVKSSNHT
ncbi:uncharacterized protein LOC131319308 isoform X1 [Rhododendron vialii]|uniref:uncharacterized protein LOC131319308 isoform X1 n=1 Tax=Rhododendron vialii TaxID=182163 RepID=UPI00265ED350|nr:uncharacterized protein LOC131319308 isoform X1 [Rhododendron vialii]XP_058205489.1 uncharacterized protein LOC131319308 isoform X1 [Rhododendron vialii]